MRPRRNRPLFIIDIAVPRDVEPDVGNLDQVFLYNIDDLQTHREGEPRAARRRAGTRRGDRRGRGRAVRRRGCSRARSFPTVVALRQRFETIRQGRAARLEPKLAGLPPEARARVDEITRLIVEKLLLTPTEQLKAVSDEATDRRLCGRAEQAVQPANPDRKLDARQSGTLETRDAGGQRSGTK